MADTSAAHQEPDLYKHETLNRHELARRRIGTVLNNKWTLTHLLGVGGMAAVYAAKHRNGHKAAIKLLSFGVSTTPTLCQRFLQEGSLANKIKHPAIVKILDDHLDHAQEYAYLVMELLEGETVRERVERTGPLPALDAIDITLELTDCLRAAHGAGVVHRDIKPENLFLTASGLKVLDFGIARALDSTQANLTRTGAFLGTPAYMSPEQARGKSSSITTATDIYSVGATFLFMLSGRTLHEGESAQELMVRAAWTPAIKACERSPGMHPALGELIDKACAFKPEDRYVSSAEMHGTLSKLRLFLAQNPPPTIRSYHAPRLSAAAPSLTSADTVIHARPGRRHRGLITAATAFVVTAGGYWLLVKASASRDEPPSSTTPLTAVQSAQERLTPPAGQENTLATDIPRASSSPAQLPDGLAPAPSDFAAPTAPPTSAGSAKPATDAPRALLAPAKPRPSAASPRSPAPKLRPATDSGPRDLGY